MNAIEVRLIIVPPGGGNQDYSLPFVLPGVPSPGDAISVKRGNEVGTEDFIVRHVHWHLKTDAADRGPAIGVSELVNVECEFAYGPLSSESHKRACDGYRDRGKAPQQI